MTRSYFCLPLLPLFTLCLLIGCGGSNSSQHRVTGTVTLDGQAIESGEIVFQSAGGAESSEGGTIENGSYDVLVSPGTKRVTINATREDSKPAADGLPNYIQYIPKQYNTNSELNATIDSGFRSPLNFELKSKP